jgi:hypothetical protein
MDIAKADDSWYKDKVFYRGEWGGGSEWTKNAQSHTQPTQIMTSGSTVNMIMAAAYTSKLLEKGRIVAG